MVFLLACGYCLFCVVFIFVSRLLFYPSELYFKERMNKKPTRKQAITQKIAKGCNIKEKRGPYRTIVTKKEDTMFSNGILGDSLVYGVFLPNTMVTSCPGGTIATIAESKIIEEFDAPILIGLIQTIIVSVLSLILASAYEDFIIEDKRLKSRALNSSNILDLVAEIEDDPDETLSLLVDNSNEVLRNSLQELLGLYTTCKWGKACILSW